ncbi:MAG: hypothetical protein IJ736_00750 [Firmicutes bacterium]|nr:hypothetical protein [Bacillota bacterium]
MQAKSFLFGLGIGFILTASINYVVYNSQEKDNIEVKAEISDEEIRDKARELGMVELSALPSKNDENAVNETVISAQATVAEAATQRAENITEATTATVVNSGANNSSNAANEPVYVTLNIPSGTSAAQFGEIIEEAGIVSDGNDFTWYLVENKNTRRIKTGNVTLKKNATYEEICDVIIE